METVMEKNYDRFCLNLPQDSRPFFTEESYNRLSLKPSLERFLEDSKLSNVNIHQGLETDPKLKSPKLGYPFPRKSSLTWSQQQKYLELYHKFSTYVPQLSSKQDLNNIEHFKKLQMQVGQEQEEFMSYLRSIAIDHPEDYSFTSTKVNEFMKRYLEHSLKRLYGVPRYYTVHQTLSLRAGAVYKTDAVMKFIKHLIITGKRKIIDQPCLSSYKGIMKNQAILDQITCISHHQDLSLDPRITGLVAENPVDFIISSEALLTLLDNHPPNYDQQWEIPVTIRHQKKGSTTQKVVVIDAPLLKKTYLPKEQNTLFHTQIMKHHLNDVSMKQNEQSEQKTGKQKTTENLTSSSQPKKLKTNEMECDFGDDLEIDLLETFGFGNSKKLFPKGIQIKQKATRNNTSSNEQIQKATKCQQHTSQELYKSIEQHQNDNSVNVVEVQETFTNKFIDSQGPNLSNNSVDSQHSVCSSKCVNQDNLPHTKFQDESVCEEKQEKSVEKLNQRSGVQTCTKETLFSESSDTEHELVIVQDSSSHDEGDGDTFQKDQSHLTGDTVSICNRNYVSGVLTRNRKKTQFDDHEMKKDSSDECHSIVNQNTKPNGTNVDETLDKFSPLRRSTRLKGLHRPDTSQKNVLLCKMDSDEKNTETSFKEPGVCESMEENCLVLTPASPDEKDRGNPVHVPLKQFSEQGAENVTIHQELQQNNSQKDDVFAYSAKCLDPRDVQRQSEEFMKKLSTNEHKADNIGQTRLPSSDDAEDGETSYSLWSFGKFQILVKSSTDGRSKVQSQQDVSLYIQPKLEYQPAFGHEQLTVSEVCRGWLKLFLTPGAQLIRGRINVITSELLKLEYVDLKSILNPLVPFSPGQSMKMLHSCLKSLS
ncbi:little elongation complex subunit 2-like isoform X2 [Anneissia japonica]|nr:little elongation complex subunit 2-like isoform X2 [Anneissia japonica]